MMPLRLSPSSLTSSSLSGSPKVASPLQSTQAECTQRPVGLDLMAVLLLRGACAGATDLASEDQAWGHAKCRTCPP